MGDGGTQAYAYQVTLISTISTFSVTAGTDTEHNDRTETNTCFAGAHGNYRQFSQTNKLIHWSWSYIEYRKPFRN